jgi:predicted nuclease of predicted toxin-antitoxin system
MPLKFIVDAQLPKRLSDFLNSNGYSSIHTIELLEKTEPRIT